jgi:hypothetical protein
MITYGLCHHQVVVVVDSLVNYVDHHVSQVVSKQRLVLHVFYVHWMMKRYE